MRRGGRLPNFNGFCGHQLIQKGSRRFNIQKKQFGRNQGKQRQRERNMKNKDCRSVNDQQINQAEKVTLPARLNALVQQCIIAGIIPILKGDHRLMPFHK